MTAYPAAYGSFKHPELTNIPYVEDTVPLIVWSAAEIAVTMICIGLPVLRPLYKRVSNDPTSRNSGVKYRNSSSGRLSRVGSKDMFGSRDIYGNRPNRKDLENGHSAGCDMLDVKASHAARDNRFDEKMRGLDFRNSSQITVPIRVYMKREHL